MNKKVLTIIVLIVVLGIGLFVLTGCGNKTNSQSTNGGDGEIGDNGNRIITCTDPQASGTTWSVEVDKNNKLLYVIKKSTYKSSAESYELSKSNSIKTVDTENAKGYDFRTSEIEWDDENYTITITRKWDAIKNIEGIDIPSTLKYVKEDGTFDIEGWKAKFESSNKN